MILFPANGFGTGIYRILRVPLSTSFGRRPVYLASLLLCFGSAIWRARAQTYGSFMGASVLNGLAAGPAEVGFDECNNEVITS